MGGGELGGLDGGQAGGIGPRGVRVLRHGGVRLAHAGAAGAGGELQEVARRGAGLAADGGDHKKNNETAERERCGFEDFFGGRGNHNYYVYSVRLIS